MSASNVVIVDYGSGNLRSVAKAFEHVAASHTSITVSNNPKDIASASHLVLPGVGAFGDCMQGLTAISGMREALEMHVHQHQRPFFGICVGMQLLFETGLEHGSHQGLGWLKGAVVPIEPKDKALKIPHMGWNSLEIATDHALFSGIKPQDHAYFVHSFHAQAADEKDVLATVTYGQTITAVVGREHIMGTQFHPEKSQHTGLTIIKNFIEL
jgi:glutamine amidotransferase